MQNARCKNKKLQIEAADSRVDSKISKMQFWRKIYSADIILQIAAQIWPQKVFDIKISTPCAAEDKPGIYLLCSTYSDDWYEKCEVVNEFLTSAFLGKRKWFIFWKRCHKNLTFQVLVLSIFDFKNAFISCLLSRPQATTYSLVIWRLLFCLRTPPPPRRGAHDNSRNCRFWNEDPS